LTPNNLAGKHSNRYSDSNYNIGAVMKKEMTKIAKTEVKKHEKALHGMKKGGPTSLDMKKYGRGMARVMNQRSSGRGR
jgi:hypothetical protein